MFGKTIIKVTRNTCGHTYTLGDFYFLDDMQTQRGYYKLLAILPKVNVQGNPMHHSGGNIGSTDFIRVDAFNSNVELVTFLKEKEGVLLTSVLNAVNTAVSFREEIKKITEFDNKEDYMTARIQECKDALSKKDTDEDAQGKQILTLLATLT